MVNRLLLLGALLVGLVGCGTNASNRITVRAQGQSEMDIPNDDLQDDIEIVSGKALYEGDILVGNVKIVSRETVKQTFQYRWRWSDSDDFKAETGGGADTWQTDWIEAEDDKQMIGKAVQPGMVAGRFELRYKK